MTLSTKQSRRSLLASIPAVTAVMVPAAATALSEFPARGRSGLRCDPGTQGSGSPV
jgi:hypothetical protein